MLAGRLGVGDVMRLGADRGAVEKPRMSALRARASLRAPAQQCRAFAEIETGAGRRRAGTAAIGRRPSALKPSTVKRHRPSAPPASTKSTSPGRARPPPARARSRRPSRRCRARRALRAAERVATVKARRERIAHELAARVAGSLESVGAPQQGLSVSNIPPVVPPSTTPSRRRAAAARARRLRGRRDAPWRRCAKTHRRLPRARRRQPASSARTSARQLRQRTSPASNSVSWRKPRWPVISAESRVGCRLSERRHEPDTGDRDARRLHAELPGLWRAGPSRRARTRRWRRRKRRQRGPLAFGHRDPEALLDGHRQLQRVERIEPSPSPNSGAHSSMSASRLAAQVQSSSMQQAFDALFEVDPRRSQRFTAFRRGHDVAHLRPSTSTSAR